jgi:ABC-2 type transport system ATP-binding protein/lipopolysaccharide transport system ATP-binding protein
MGPAIELENVSKRYLLGEDYGPGRTLREAITSSLRHVLRRGSHDREELWSLRDISFSVEEGEALGVIGRNGAGKSTLLKVLTRITEPTSGVARTRGRVGALLEVGAGFHWELTGRENIYLNGAILGMTRREIDTQFDAIAAFAGMERFLDTPVKRYSSGMYLRLAFSIAAHLAAEILLVDEVLAVGDMEFQRKCLGKMDEVGRSGRTVVFVSHNLDAIAKLCPRTVWLDRGRIQAIGPTEQIIEEYLGSAIARGSHVSLPAQPEALVALRSVALFDAHERGTVVLRRDEPFVVELHFDVHEDVPSLDATICIESLRGVRVIDEAWSDRDHGPRGAAGEYIARVELPPILNPGDYTVSVFIGTAHDTFVWEEQILQFRLEGDAQQRPDRVLQLSLPWKVSSAPFSVTTEHRHG